MKPKENDVTKTIELLEDIIKYLVATCQKRNASGSNQCPGVDWCEDCPLFEYCMDFSPGEFQWE